MSADSSEAEGYRRSGSRSIARSVIHSSSPFSARSSVRASVERLPAVSPVSLRAARSAGVGGSARTIRIASGHEALRSLSRSNGRSPASSSYSSTPSE